MAIQINRLGHAGILVSDLEESLKFYTEILGCKVNNQLPPGLEGDQVHTYFLGVGDVHHAVVITRAPEGVDVSSEVGQSNRQVQQLAFEVEDQVQFSQAVEHLRANGVEIIEGPLVHARDDHNPRNSGSTSVYFRDPDGNRLEFFTGAVKVGGG